MASLIAPQAMKKVDTAAIPTSRVKSIQQEEMSTNFLNTIAAGVDKHYAREEQEDRRMTSLISARYRELADKERLAAEGEVAKSQGWNVLNTSREQTVGLTQKLNDLKGQFDEKYEPYLENVRLDTMNKYTRAHQPYVISQIKKTTKETYDAVIANEMNDTILDSGNLENFSANLDRIRSTVKEKLFVEKGDDENAEVAPGMTLKSLIDEETGAAVSKTVANSVGQLAALGHVKNAEELFRKHDADMNADDRLRAVESLKKAANAEEGRASIAMADMIQKQANDLVEAETMVSEMSANPKQRRTVMAILQQRLDAANTVKKQKIENNTASIYSGLSQGKGFSDPGIQKLMGELPVEEQNRIVETINKNNGKVVPGTTNFQKFDEALERLYNDRAAIESPSFMQSYLPHLAPSDYDFLQSQYNARKRQSADKQEWIRVNTGKVVLDDVVRFNNEMGIYNPDAISKNKRIAIEFADTLMSQNPKMDQVELQKRVKAFMFKNSAMPERKERGVISKAWNSLFGDGLDYSVNYKNPQSPDAINSKGEAVSYTEEDKEAFRKSVQDAFKKQGKTASPEAIEKAMRERMLNGRPLK